jgi:hypothetical protein
MPSAMVTVLTENRKDELSGWTEPSRPSHELVAVQIGYLQQRARPNSERAGKSSGRAKNSARTSTLSNTWLKHTWRHCLLVDPWHSQIFHYHRILRAFRLNPETTINDVFLFWASSVDGEETRKWRTCDHFFPINGTDYQQWIGGPSVSFSSAVLALSLFSLVQISLCDNELMKERMIE